MSAKRRKQSARWLDEHERDRFVRQARERRLRSRATFKLEAVDSRDRLLRPGMTVVDLGAAPGGWSQYAAARVTPGGQVLALDMLEMPALAGVSFIRGDFAEQATLDALLEALGDGRADLVLSDMAPNMSGVNAIDQPRAMALAELAFELCEKVLCPGGDFLVKVFQGAGLDGYRARLSAAFTKVATRKPPASRERSRELYLLARNFRL